MKFSHVRFTRRATDKAVAHLTLGPSQEDEEIQYYQASSLAIRAAVEHYLYGNLGHPVPPRIIKEFKEANPKRTQETEIQIRVRSALREGK